MSHIKNIIILIAEDDPDDCLMLEEAFSELNAECNLFFVNDGEELLQYLKGIKKYSDRERYPLPNIILLDLNMPKVDGREALKTIKNDENLRLYPVIVFTTSDAEGDIDCTYDSGVNCFIQKPNSFKELKVIVNRIFRYWFKVVTLPENSKS
ncbi:MAG: response regulator [Chitinophagaceae bacterium]|nr:MAG: response regulator [Chitinophagaceae bacterium]